MHCNTGVATKEHAIGSHSQRRRTTVCGRCINLNKYSTFRAMSHSTGGAFPNPSTFDAIRSPPERCLHGGIAFQVIGVDIPPKPIVRVLRVILSFNNVRLVPNQSGELGRFEDSSLSQYRYLYLNKTQFLSLWPASLLMLYDILDQAKDSRKPGCRKSLLGHLWRIYSRMSMLPVGLDVLPFFLSA